MQEFITLAHHLADEAGAIVRQYYRQPFDVESKQDESPVTIADKNVEQRLRAIVEAKRPEDGIIGEEYGTKDSKNQYTWVFDPIDGTKSFVIGRPTFGTLIALCENGVPILGVIDQPILKERWIGVKDMPTLFNGKPVTTRKCSGLKEAIVAATAPSMFDDRGLFLEKNFKATVWGGDCYAYGMIASGYADAVIEHDMGLHDFIAMPPIIEGAGGLVCAWDGSRLTSHNTGKSSVLALADPQLKEPAIELLKNLN